MSWTLLVIVAIIAFFIASRYGEYLEIISRVPVTYSHRERIGWACAFALLVTFAGDGGLHYMFGLVVGTAIYLRGPQYYTYRLRRFSQ